MKQRPPIVVERELPVPPGEAFAAFGDPEALAIWMCPSPDMTKATVELDFRVGGRFRITMHGEREYGQTGEYLVVEPGKRLAFTWVSDWLPEADRNTRVTVTFEPTVAGTTRLVLVHDELPDTGSYDGHEAGWSRIADCMIEWLSR